VLDVEQLHLLNHILHNLHVHMDVELNHCISIHSSLYVLRNTVVHYMSLETLAVHNLPSWMTNHTIVTFILSFVIQFVICKLCVVHSRNIGCHHHSHESRIELAVHNLPSWMTNHTVVTFILSFVIQFVICKLWMYI
jgi:uncharacterized membrane protein YhdT